MFHVHRKDFRDMLRSIGSTSSLLFQSLLAQTAGIAAPDTLAMLRHPGYELLFGPIYTHMWLFRTIVSEVSHVAQTLSAGNNRGVLWCSMVWCGVIYCAVYCSVVQLAMPGGIVLIVFSDNMYVSLHVSTI